MLSKEDQARLDRIMKVPDGKAEDSSSMTPLPPRLESPASPSGNSDAIRAKREELELKKLEAEIAKISAPSTNIDYFQKMLELQDKNHQMMMQMMQQQFSLQLEVEKMKLSDGDNMMPMILEILSPIIPKLLASQTPAQGQTGYPVPVQTPTEKPINQQALENAKTEAKTEDMTLEGYKQLIREGKVDVEKAWIDFQEQLPQYAKVMTKEQFVEKFNAIKEGKA